MRVSVVTPSYRQSNWLRLCIASVADQGVECEHIVQDGGSDDGTLEWLTSDTRVRAFLEKDEGMYDAVNRGLKRATGEILAYLNCDEQYLPGTLSAVLKYFEHNPGTDMLFGDVIKVDAEGSYLGFRRMQTPLLYHTWTCHLSTLTCATFFRRSIVDRGFFFDPAWRSGGDGEWMVRLLKAGIPMATLNTYTSVFTQTGANLSGSPQGAKEAVALRNTAPSWVRAARGAWVLGHRARRFWGGMYSGAPRHYEIYTLKNPSGRVRFRGAD